MAQDELKKDEAGRSFSEILKQGRLSQDLSIDDVVTATRISKNVVEQLETEGSTQLPEPVFTRGFIKSYAQFLGLDPCDLIHRYHMAYGIEITPAIDEQKLIDTSRYSKRRSMAWVFWLFGILLLFTVAGIVSLSMGWFSDSLETQETPPSSIEPSHRSPEEPSPDTSKPIPAGEYRLEIVCVEKTLMKIVVDDGLATNYEMTPEDHLELVAKTGFNVLIYNTCGVTLFLNEKPVDVPGKCGRTVNIRLPES